MAEQSKDASGEAPAGREVIGRSPIFTPEVINDIHMKAELGRYRMRGFSMFKKLPGWDDLIFLPGTLTRFVIEGYREKCDTTTVLGSPPELQKFVCGKVLYNYDNLEPAERKLVL